MPWTIEEIERDWLGGPLGGVAVDDDLTAVFQRVEDALGRDYLERARGGEGVKGTLVVAAIVRRDKILRAIAGAKGAPELVARLRSGDVSADAEATAVYLCRPPFPVEVELAPGLNREVGVRVADLRLRRKDEPWIYVEVSAPQASEAHQEADRVVQEMAARMQELPIGTAAEIFLRRAPSTDEQEFIGAEMVRLSSGTRPAVRDLPGLCILTVKDDFGGVVTLEHHGEPSTSRIGVAKAEITPQGRRLISVRYPFVDERAVVVLRKEARQLPKESPGIVMIAVNRATGASRQWPTELAKRLQPELHARVGAVCLWISGMMSTAAGEAWVPETVLVINPHARRVVPRWLLDRLRSFEHTITGL